MRLRLVLFILCLVPFFGNCMAHEQKILGTLRGKLEAKSQVERLCSQHKENIKAKDSSFKGGCSELSFKGSKKKYYGCESTYNYNKGDNTGTGEYAKVCGMAGDPKNTNLKPGQDPIDLMKTLLGASCDPNTQFCE